MQLKNQFSEILKSLRSQENWPQSYLASKLDISLGTYSAYERGLSDPPLSVVIKLSNLFDVSIDYLANGKEFSIPLTTNETNYQNLDRMTLRLENRIERQSRLLSHISMRIESDLSRMVKQYSDDFADIFSRSAGIVLLEEEAQNLEKHSQVTRVAYPDLDDNLTFNNETDEYSEGDYLHNIIANLRENPDNQYIEIYAEDVDLAHVRQYQNLLKQRCGKAALNRMKMLQCQQPIITQYVIYELNLERLRQQQPALFELVKNHTIDNCYIALLITPQLNFPDVNLLADKRHCGYIMNHFNYLLKQSIGV